MSLLKFAPNSLSDSDFPCLALYLPHSILLLKDRLAVRIHNPEMCAKNLKMKQSKIF